LWLRLDGPGFLLIHGNCATHGVVFACHYNVHVAGSNGGLGLEHHHQRHVDQAHLAREPQGLGVAMAGLALSCRVIPALDEQDAEQKNRDGENPAKCAARLGHRLLARRPLGSPLLLYATELAR
jgi:hypothetical protein